MHPESHCGLVFISFAKTLPCRAGHICPSDTKQDQQNSGSLRPLSGAAFAALGQEAAACCLRFPLCGGLRFYCQGNGVSPCFFLAGHCLWDCLKFFFGSMDFLCPFFSCLLFFSSYFCRNFLNSAVERRHSCFLQEKSHHTGVCLSLLSQLLLAALMLVAAI